VIDLEFILKCAMYELEFSKKCIYFINVFVARLGSTSGKFGGGGRCRGRARMRARESKRERERERERESERERERKKRERERFSNLG
jgi:hypothetical protein